ncbi:GIY-YIG nuclease family protein [Brevundimonas denitrificans]|uniref:GIY-YIG nuclease family protein n=1 Tax=Brevundimonas denitrificans TaxID=1443434 RepID=UPI00352F3AF1
MALQWGGGALPDGPDVEAGRIQAERALTEWMKANILVGYRSCSYVKDVETAILDATASPFNLRRSNPSAYADALQDLRRRSGTTSSAAGPSLKANRTRECAASLPRHPPAKTTLWGSRGVRRGPVDRCSSSRC